jgi:hypothetical protein
VTVSGLALLVGVTAAAGACNAITGADDLEVLKGGDPGGGQGVGGFDANTSGPGTGATTGAGTASTTGNTGSGATTGAGPGSSSSGGGMCAPCGANQYCEAATNSCVCNPGYVMQGGSCVQAPIGDPSTHTQQDVCDKWTSGHVVTEPDPITASGADCDAGVLKQAAIVDTLTRMNMFRWLSGLGPTSDDAGFNTDAQLCANLEAWWDFGNAGSPHFPPAGSKCYTAAGASTAGQSNIAWGSGHPAQAIDQFMEDNGNATTMGHRRWILNPPLGPVGIGYWETGGQYGNSECLRVFGSSGGGPNPPWSSMPNAGFVPLPIAQWTWTFHGSMSGIPNAQISVLRVDDNTPLAVDVHTLQQGYAQDAISWDPSGWSPQAGMTYRVTVSGLGGGDVVYDVKPVVCN